MKCPRCGYLVPAGIWACPRCRLVVAQQHAHSPADPVQVAWLSTGGSSRRAPLLIGAAALVVIGLAVLVAVRLTSGTETAQPNAPVPIPTGVTTSSASATPTSSPSNDPTPSPSPPPSSAAPGLKFRRVVFRHFSVDLRDAKVTGADGLLIRARVCVRRLPPDPQGDKTRISWDPWRVVTKGGITHKPELFDASHPPTKLFPADRTYRVGSCATGWIPFADVTSLDDVSTIRYRNSLGESAEWRRS